MNARPTWPLLRLFNRRRAIAHANHAPRPVDVARKHEYAERCCRCNATAQAIELVRAGWVVAGIDLGE